MLKITQRPASGEAASIGASSIARLLVSSLAWLVPAAATAVVALQSIGTPLLWRDELATWSAASRSLPQLWFMVQHIDAVHGVYYLLIHEWMGMFGSSPTALRVPSVLAMAGTAALVVLIGKRLGGILAGMAGGLVFAVLPSVSRYAQEIRVYAFATFFAALAMLLLLRALERSQWWRWAVYALAIAATGACNLVALCMLIGHALFVQFKWNKEAGLDRRRTWLVFVLAAVVGVAIDIPIILKGQAQSKTQIGSLLHPSFGQLVGGWQQSLWPALFCSSAVAIAALALAALSLAGRDRGTAVLLLLSALLPIVVIWGVSQGPSSYWNVRYLLFTLPMWSVAAGFGATALARRLEKAGRWWRYLSYALALALIAVPGVLGIHDQQVIRQVEAHNWWRYPVAVGNGSVDYGAAAGVIAAHQLAGDDIVYQVADANHWQVDEGVEYYLRGHRRPDPLFQIRSEASVGTLQAEVCDRVQVCVPTLVLDMMQGTPRIWVVYIDRLMPPGTNVRSPFEAIPPAQAAALHSEHYHTKQIYQVKGITIALLTVKPKK